MTSDTFTNQELMLDVGDGHQLYVHDWGYKDAAVPIFLLHGGPGGQSKDSHKQYFDPTTQRVIFHDQRGAGNSQPYGSLDHNTTTDLVGDIVRIATELGIEKFILFGGSWGSCLALAFALKYPDKVCGMVLHGIFTGSQSEIDWIDQGQFQQFFPDVWERYLAATPAEHHSNPSAYHLDRVLSDDVQAAKHSGLAYETVESGVMSLDDRQAASTLEDYDPSDMRIEMNYMSNRCYLPDNYILDNAHTLPMPISLIQGRYDMVCPPITAYELAKGLPNAQLVMTISGHRGEHETWNAVRLALKHLTD